VGGVGLVVELDAVELGPADRRFLVGERPGVEDAERSCTALGDCAPSPTAPSATSATSSAFSTGGFSVPSMKPERSRLSL
jgi:hypothetical protein